MLAADKCGTVCLTTGFATVKRGNVCLTGVTAVHLVGAGLLVRALPVLLVRGCCSSCRTSFLLPYRYR